MPSPPSPHIPTGRLEWCWPVWVRGGFVTVCTQYVLFCHNSIIMCITDWDNHIYSCPIHSFSTWLLSHHPSPTQFTLHVLSSPSTPSSLPSSLPFPLLPGHSVWRATEEIIRGGAGGDGTNSPFTLAWNGYEPVHGIVLKNGSASVYTSHCTRCVYHTCSPVLITRDNRMWLGWLVLCLWVWTSPTLAVHLNSVHEYSIMYAQEMSILVLCQATVDEYLLHAPGM